MSVSYVFASQVLRLFMSMMCLFVTEFQGQAVLDLSGFGDVHLYALCSLHFLM